MSVIILFLVTVECLSALCRDFLLIPGIFCFWLLFVPIYVMIRFDRICNFFFSEEFDEIFWV